ncbi:MAG: MurR/RpiR family transcriptional regulator [Spirochaetia bacterium]|nr:MurR/RpiR family transcriptional regulator [Spirochaetia bacterium]
MKNKISEQYDSLTKQQKKIATYILDNMNDVIFENVTFLAEQTGTSVASVVRFANALGYDGFPQLKEDLINYYKNQMDIADRFKRTIDNLPEGRPSFAAISQSEVDYLQKAVSTLDQNAFDQVVDLICAAQKVYVFGNSSNESLANNLWFRLDRLGLEVLQLSQSGHCLIERLFKLNADDVIVVFDFFTPSLDTTRIHELHERNRAKIISVTDTINPSMIKNSTVVLHAKRGSPENFNSHVVPSAIINALVIAVAHELGQPAIDKLKELSKLREVFSYPPLDNSMRLENIR